MYRTFFRPKWLLTHLLAITLVVVMVNLSLWQFNRLDKRKAFNALVELNAAQPVVPLDKLLTSEPASIEWRRVIVRGSFLSDKEVLAVNRSQDGTAGADPITPFAFSSEGKNFVVLVDRGFVPLSEVSPAPPSGEVELIGRVRLSQNRRVGSLSDPSTGVLKEIQHINVSRLTTQVQSNAGEKVVPFYLDLLESPQVTTALPARVANPITSNGSHLSYAIQWLLFAACAIAAWVILVRRSLTAAQLASTLAE
jgi:surfeit locus 1 family protein